MIVQGYEYFNVALSLKLQAVLAPEVWYMWGKNCLGKGWENSYEVIKPF